MRYYYCMSLWYLWINYEHTSLPLTAAGGGGREIEREREYTYTMNNAARLLYEVYTMSL